ncbi:MAG TPA: hypothetical protein VKT28_08560 [Puia sp.]|nr:hypothetical protein [Puia sp.]
MLDEIKQLTQTDWLAILGFCALIISFLETFKSKSFKVFKIILSALIGILILAITLKKDRKDLADKQQSDNSNRQHEISDSIHRIADSLSGLKFDSLSKTMVVIDSSILKKLLEKPSVIVDAPSLELKAKEIGNPVFILKHDSTFKFAIAIKARGKSIAHDIVDFNVALAMHNGELQFITDNTHGANKSTEIDENGIELVTGGTISVSPFDLKQSDIFYEFVKIEFSDAKGKKQPPFVKIFQISKDDIIINKLIPVPEATASGFDDVKKILQKNKLW